jgi:hypothetical protein
MENRGQPQRTWWRVRIREAGVLAPSKGENRGTVFSSLAAARKDINGGAASGVLPKDQSIGGGAASPAPKKTERQIAQSCVSGADR